MGSFTCVTHHMGPTALLPIRRTKHFVSGHVKKILVQTTFWATLYKPRGEHLVIHTTHLLNLIIHHWFTLLCSSKMSFESINLNCKWDRINSASSITEHYVFVMPVITPCARIEFIVNVRFKHKLCVTIQRPGFAIHFFSD